MISLEFGLGLVVGFLVSLVALKFFQPPGSGRVAIALLLLVPSTSLGNPLRSHGVTDPQWAACGSVCRVHSGNSQGSGVYVGNGYVLTAKHILQQPSSLVVFTTTRERIQATPLYSGTTADVAILGLYSHPSVPAVPVAQAEPAPGEVLALAGHIGNSARMQVVPVRNLRSRFGSSYEFGDKLPYHPGGISGGPCINQAGCVVGPVWGHGSPQDPQLGFSVTQLRYTRGILGRARLVQQRIYCPPGGT